MSPQIKNLISHMDLSAGAGEESMLDPLSEKALGNPVFNMATMGFGTKAKFAKNLTVEAFVAKEGVKDTAIVITSPQAKQIEQYALKAAKDGFYLVMQRGFKDPVGEIFLNRGDIWKYGITINPETRYSQPFLRDTGQGLKYFKEFSSPFSKSSLSVEKAICRKGENYQI